MFFKSIVAWLVSTLDGRRVTRSGLRFNFAPGRVEKNKVPLGFWVSKSPGTQTKIGTRQNDLGKWSQPVYLTTEYTNTLDGECFTYTCTRIYKYTQWLMFYPYLYTEIHSMENVLPIFVYTNTLDGEYFTHICKYKYTWRWMFYSYWYTEIHSTGNVLPIFVYRNKLDGECFTLFVLV